MLSEKAKAHLDQAMAGENNADSREIAAAIDSLHAVSPAAHVANASAASPITISTGLSTSDTYTDAAVNSAVNTAVNGALTTVVTDVNALESKINAILAALQAAGLMS